MSHLSRPASAAEHQHQPQSNLTNESLAATIKPLLGDGDLFLGFDSSTQGLKLVVLEYKADRSALDLLMDFGVNYDSDLPDYGTRGGVHRHEDGLTVTAPTLMWIDALDLLLSKVKESGIKFERVRAISGSGQQHGSVYWNAAAAKALSQLSASATLAEQLKNCFSVQNSPIWMDSSTTDICREMETIFPNGAEGIAQRTGSRAYERFTLSQIAKIARTRPQDYANTSRISLVSSFMASLLCGAITPIDDGDGAGMNLLNLETKSWVPELLKFGGENLEAKLGSPAVSSSVVGLVSPYFVSKYGFSPECQVIAFSGDNPCSLVGLRLRSDHIGISLGTSDTIFGATKQLKPNAQEGHVFCDPGDAEGYMVLLCYKNGSLTREFIRDKFASGSWAHFNESLGKTQAGNNEKIGIFFVEPEITPPAAPGLYRFNDSDQPVASFEDPHSEVRAVIEGQFLSMLIHSRKLGLSVKSILATGGASKNGHIIQILSDVFGAPVFVGEVANSAALGGAFKAFHGFVASKPEMASSSILSGKALADVVEPFTSAFSFSVGAQPNSTHHKTYIAMAERYAKLEAAHVRPL